jgi:FtsP/CotA-like multicopper oxidase with cupredoxin domain
MEKIERRKFIKLGGAAAVLTLSWPLLSSCTEGVTDKKPLKANPDFNPDIEIELVAKENKLSFFPDRTTDFWSFESKLIKGGRSALQKMENSYIGPIIRVRKGQKIRIHFRNELPEESIVHWHGMHVPEEYDGHPTDVIANGQTYVYEYEIMNRAGTYWFHPHPHGRTGPQVYNGLAGMFIVTDEEEEKLNLPSGEFDVPVVIQDRTFDADRQLVYQAGGGGMHGNMRGFLGEQIVINGKSDNALSLKSGCRYRLRLLNGSNSRFYKLGWEDGTPLTIIGIDGSLLDTPKTMPYAMLAVAKRLDLWVDLEDKPVGAEIKLKSFPFSSGMMGGGMMDGNDNTLQLGGEYELFSIKIDQESTNDFSLPTQLVPFNKIAASTAINKQNPRTFKFYMDHMEWTINGNTWEPREATEQETVKLNTTEIWELVNSGGGMMGGGMMGGDGMMGNGEMMGGNDEGSGMGNMMQMPHPIHIHQVQFNILERDTSEMDTTVWNSIKEGFIDEGWQDTVLLMPGMKIKIIMRFEDYKGLFVYHCHNLEHEDMGMMRNFRIT